MCSKYRFVDNLREIYLKILNWRERLSKVFLYFYMVESNQSVHSQSKQGTESPNSLGTAVVPTKTQLGSSFPLSNT